MWRDKPCWTLLLALPVALALSACGSLQRAQPYQPAPTAAGVAELAPPERRIAAAVYDFPDLTGQHREAPSGDPHYSRTVSQGGAVILGRVLETVGEGQWFTVVERNRLDNLRTERQIGRDQRDATLAQAGELRYADVIFEGGIIGYDSNTLTGGAGAGFLGIGASTRYREDVVTVYLRAVSSQTGEVWNSVVAAKRIYSQQVGAYAFRYVGSDDILELEVGYTRNEPRLIALTQAIEQAVTSLIAEGVERGLPPFVGLEPAPERLPASQLLHEPLGWRLHLAKDQDYSFEHEALLAEIVDYARRYPASRVEVYGHADDSGDPAYNRLLSEDRAWNIAMTLRRLGLDAARVSYVGKGTELPIASNATVEGRAMNRRVDVLLTPTVMRATD